MQPLIWTLQAGQMTQDLPVKLLIVLKIILTREEGGLNQNHVSTLNQNELIYLVRSYVFGFVIFWSI